MPKRRRSELFPALLPALVTAVVVTLLYGILWVLGIAFLSSGSSIVLFTAFGASAFLLFTAPHSPASRLDKFVKSYIIAAILGPIGYLLAGFVTVFIAIGIMVFVMSALLYATRSEHPPAIGIMLAFIIYRIDIYGALLVVLGVLIIITARLLIGKRLYAIDMDIEKPNMLR